MPGVFFVILGKVAAAAAVPRLRDGDDAGRRIGKSANVDILCPAGESLAPIFGHWSESDDAFRFVPPSSCRLYTHKQQQQKRKSNHPAGTARGRRSVFAF